MPTVIKAAVMTPMSVQGYVSVSAECGSIVRALRGPSPIGLLKQRYVRPTRLSA